MRVIATIKTSKIFREAEQEGVVLRPIPQADDEQQSILLELNTFGSSQEGGSSNPSGEIRILANIIAVYTESKMTIQAVDVPDRAMFKGQRFDYNQWLGGGTEFPTVSDLKAQINSLGIDLGRQFIRACTAYAEALHSIPDNPTFAFLLLSVAIECLSSQDSSIPFSDIHPEGKSAERFVEFVRRYLPTSMRSVDESNETLLTELIKPVYYDHRSAYVHGGREVTEASHLADLAGSSYFLHATLGPEQKAPGLAWFASVVRRSLLGFLEKRSKVSTEPANDVVVTVALEQAMLKVKASRAIQKNQAVSLSDITYRED